MVKKRSKFSNQKPIVEKPPDSLGQALIHLLWPIRPLWRNLIIFLAGLIITGFLVWKTLPESTKADILVSLFNRNSAGSNLTPQQIKDRNFYVDMGDSYIMSNPDQARAYYQKALKIDPENKEIQKKVADALRK